MQSDDYKLEFLPLFYEELNEAAMYITDELQNPDDEMCTSEWSNEHFHRVILSEGDDLCTNASNLLL